MRCGQKIVQDVDQSTGQNIEYRDEHSSPFAWRSRSQQVVRDRYLLKNNQQVVRDGYLLKNNQQVVRDRYLLKNNQQVVRDDIY